MQIENCPFCGGNASRQDLTDDDNAGGSCITCDSCGASSPVHFDRKENLYDSWNRRSPSSSEDVRREALERAFAEIEALNLGRRDTILRLRAALSQKE